MKKLIFIISLMSLFPVKAKVCICQWWNVWPGGAIASDPYKSGDVAADKPCPSLSVSDPGAKIYCYELEEAKNKWPGKF